MTAPVISPTVAAFLARVTSVAKGRDALQVVDPASGSVLAMAGNATEADVDDAVRAARAAFPAWSGLVPRERGKRLNALADAMEAHSEFLAEIETLNVGKPITATRTGDVPGSIAYVRYFAAWAEKIEGRVIPTGREGVTTTTRREAVGVCAQIVPWNFPLSMMIWKLAPALVTGCVSVLKPADATPLSALYLAELAIEAGLPEGVFTVVTGTGPEVGAALTHHRGVDKVAFTGSTAIGREVLHASAASNLKRVSLELGGKNPFIIFEDADLESAVRGAVKSFTGNTGQNCSAASRLLVQRCVYDDVVARLEGLAQDVRVGDPLDPSTEMGPLVSAAHREKVAGYVDIARSEGARIIQTSNIATNARTEAGFFFAPTILANSTPAMTTSREEIFGPVISVIPFDGDDDALAIANETEYGLNASVWTRDRTRSNRMVSGIRAGTLQVNCSGLTHPAAPFGGFKQSGHGREGGIDAIELYTEVKTVWESA